jgi:hypothetical protein
MRTKEFLVVADDEVAAKTLCMTQIVKYVGKRSFELLRQIEALPYLGKSKSLRGKWRAYARIGVK